MNKNFKILLIIGLNSWNNLSTQWENNSEIKVEIENKPLINESNEVKDNMPNVNTINNSLDLTDERYVILQALGFISCVFLSTFIASLGLLFQDNLSNVYKKDHETLLETPLKITIIMGMIIFLVGIILMFTKFTSWIFNGNKIPFKNTLTTNIFIIILSMLFLSFYVYALINNKLHDFYDFFYFFLPIISFIFILIITIYVIYQNKQRIKNNLINPMMDSLYTKLLDISSIFMSLLIGILIYCIFFCCKKILHESKWSGFISGTWYLLIILTVCLIRKIKIKDCLIISLSFFISYILWELFFILKGKKNTNNSLESIQIKLVASIMALQISFFVYGFYTFSNAHKSSKEFINNINQNPVENKTLSNENPVEDKSL